MPELPEVQTTVNGLNTVLKNLTITDVWSDYFISTKNTRTDNIKNETFFKKLKREISGSKFIKAERRGKNILIHLSADKTLLIHMKMTGHLLYGKYTKEKAKWRSKEEKLKDPFNQFIHFVISFDNGKSLAFSDMRKFAKVTFFETTKLKEHKDIIILGPEANDPKLDWKVLKTNLLKKPKGKIKTVLMDQNLVAGIGNIYSDEILWASSIHPERSPSSLSDRDFRNILEHTRIILNNSIKIGGDSMSDYRNVYGEKGGYQNSHKAYKQSKQKCQRKNCKGVIVRKIIGGRSTHFCPVHQK